jgi:hypothetical protein
MNKLALLVTLALATAAHAQGAPGTISFVARLADAGQPITGTHNLDVALFDASTGGTAVWTESRTGVTIPADGLLYLDLGSVTPLDATVFSGGKKYLEVTIDAEITTPRIVIESAPYAIRSGEANHSTNSDALGTHPASFFQARVSNACSSGSAIASIDAAGSVTCQPVPAYTAGTGLALTGSVFSVDTAAIQSRVSGVCASGAIATITAAGTVTCLTAGTGLAFSTGQFNVDFATTQHAITACPAGSMLSSTDSAGTATCYAPGAGVQFNNGTKAWDVNQNTIQHRVTGACAVGSAITAIASDGTVTCGGTTVFQATSAPAQTVNSAAYGNDGPQVTANIGTGHALVTLTAAITPSNGNTTLMGFTYDTTASSDAQALAADTNPTQASATYYVTVTPGNHTFTAQYRNKGGGPASVSNRSIIVQAVP